MLEDMLGTFLSSPQGQQASQALASRGINPSQIQQILSAAFPAATSSLGQQARAKGGDPNEPELGMFDLLGGHPGQAFLIGAATSMLRGEGLVDAAQDGAMSVVGAHIAEVVASRVGMDRQMSAQVAAAITPFVVGFIQEKLAGRPDVAAKRGAAPGGTWQDKFAAKHGGMPMGAPTGMGMGKQGFAQSEKPTTPLRPDGQQGRMSKPMQGDGQQQYGGKPMQGDGQQQYGGKPMPQQAMPMGKPQYEPSPMGKPQYPGQPQMPSKQNGKPMPGKG